MQSSVKTKRLESEIQRRIIQRYQQEGYMVVKLQLTNMSGFPDLMVMKEGKVFFIEVKRPGEHPRPLQVYRHRQLMEQGFEVKILTE